MSDQPLRCVVDANVVLKLFFDQPGSDLADALFSRFESDSRARFYVPGFFYAECTSALAFYVRQKQHPAGSARQDIVELLALGLDVVPTKDLATDALDIALTYTLSGYDAFYAALSRRMEVPLITADKKMVRALAGKPFDIQLLDDFSASSS